MELSFAENAVTPKTCVLNRTSVARVKMLDLTRELGEEDRITPSQSHWGAPPGGIGRQVDQVGAVRIGLSHVKLQSGASGIVATEALA
jgi:hypothetical protein